MRHSGPGAFEALFQRGLQLQESGRLPEAVDCYQRAIAVDGAVPEAHNNLGWAFLELGQFDDAAAELEKALELRPHYAAAIDNLGLLHERRGRLDEAVVLYERAVLVDPSNAAACAILGKALIVSGDIDRAIACFERALALEPRNGEFHMCLVNSRAGAVEGAHLAQMERLLAEIDTLPVPQQVELHFALAGAYEYGERYDDAFRHLHAGNALARTTLGYDEAAALRFLAAIESAFSAPFMTAMRGCGNPSARPIFIFGMPRSGTTLVEQILAAHPAVAPAGELTVFEHAIGAELMVPGLTLAALRERIRALGDRYVNATDEVAGSADRVTDKLPHNFCYAPLIHLALPNARLIHVRRDRADTCLSCYATHFAERGLAYTYDLGELGRYYSAYERMMAQWRVLLPADRFIEVDYERLVEDFESEAPRLAAFCGLPWDAGMSAFYELRRSVRTASNVQVRRPLYRSAIGRGARFAPHLGPLGKG